jgi:hypothetical protein
MPRLSLIAGAATALALLTGCGAYVSGDTGTPDGSAQAPTPASSSPTDLPTSVPPVGKPSGTVMELTGVAEAGVEAGCMVLRSGSTSYLILGAKDKVPTGVPIRVTGQVLTGVMSYCQQGTPFRVDTVTRQ